jgi:hypothetical protein
LTIAGAIERHVIGTAAAEEWPDSECFVVGFAVDPVGAEWSLVFQLGDRFDDQDEISDRTPTASAISLALLCTAGFGELLTATVR